MADDFVTWSASLVGDDGMEIRRDSASFDARVEVGEGDTYNLIDGEGRTLATFSGGGAGGGGGGGYTFSIGETRIAKDEPMFATVTATFVDNTANILPDGTRRGLGLRPDNCQCPLCQKAKGETMDRDQVARVAADIGSSLMPDNSQWMNRFTVESTSSSRVYTVAQRRSDNVWGCSCPAWINRRHCKHLDDILGRLAKLTAFDVTDPAVLDMLRSARTAYLDLDAIPDGSGRFTASMPVYRRHIDL